MADKCNFFLRRCSLEYNETDKTDSFTFWTAWAITQSLVSTARVPLLLSQDTNDTNHLTKIQQLQFHSFSCQKLKVAASTRAEKKNILVTWIGLGWFRVKFGWEFMLGMLKHRFELPGASGFSASLRPSSH
jgi:hypothetical protein